MSLECPPPPGGKGPKTQVLTYISTVSGGYIPFVSRSPGQAARPEPAHALRGQPTLRRERGRRARGPRGARLRGGERRADPPRQGDQPAAWLRLRRVRAGGGQPGRCRRGAAGALGVVAVWARGGCTLGCVGLQPGPLRRRRPALLSPGATGGRRRMRATRWPRSTARTSRGAPSRPTSPRVATRRAPRRRRSSCRRRRRRAASRSARGVRAGARQIGSARGARGARGGARHRAATGVMGGGGATSRAAAAAALRRHPRRGGTYDPPAPAPVPAPVPAPAPAPAPAHLHPQASLPLSPPPLTLDHP